MTGREHDDEFEAYLKGRRPIHKGLSTLERLEPSEELDRLIIGKARQAIQSPSSVRVFRGPRWALPVGLAAAIVVAFTALLQLGVHKATPPGVPTVTLDESTPSQPMMDKPVAAPAVTLPAAPSSAKRAPALLPAPAPPPPPALTASLAKKSVTPPPDAATWLKQIEKLRAEGQIAAAEREFKHFRDVYPDYEPPAGAPPADGPTK